MSANRLDAVFGRIYERTGTRYRWVIGGVVMFNALVSVLVVVTTSLPKLPTRDGHRLEAAVIAFLLAIACVSIAFGRFQRREFAGVLNWIDGDRGESASLAAWTSATVGPERALVLGIRIFVVGYLLYPPYVVWRLDTPATVLLAFFVVVNLTILFAAALDSFALAIVLRPILRDIGDELPPDFVPRRTTVPLLFRVMMVVSLVGVLVGYITAIFDTADTATGRLVVGILLSLVVMAVIGVGPALLLNEALATPLKELELGTQRVESGDLSTPVPVLAADEVGVLVGAFNRMMTGLREREALRDAMGSYVDPKVAERILSEGALLSGEELDVSVMFIDIRDFTAASEARTPTETVSVLNDYFELVVTVVSEHGGFVNKFLGDGMLAVFGAPLPLEDHVQCAANAALAVAAAVHQRYDGELRIGIGINSGDVVVGSVGGGGRLEFGLIGDVVNVAARVEELTKELHIPILITRATQLRLNDPHLTTRPLGPVPIRGRSEHVELFALDQRHYSRAV